MNSILNELGIKALSSGLESYDNLLCNGVPSKIITIDCGTTRCYKTLTNIQKAFSFIKQTQHPCIYVDTEGGALLTIGLWKEKFEKRFDAKYNVTEAFYDNVKGWMYEKSSVNFNNALIVVTVRDIFKLFNLHGTPIDFKITEEGGRIDVKRLKPDSLDIYIGDKKVTSEELPIESTPIGKLLSQTEPCGIIYDSLLELFKQRIPSTRENFPSRGYLLHNLLGCMQRIAETYGIPVVGIAHTSRDPADPNKKREKINAETVISYNCKFITLFRAMSESLTDFRREVTVWRHQSKAPLSESFVIQPSEMGIDEVKVK